MSQSWPFLMNMSQTFFLLSFFLLDFLQCGPMFFHPSDSDVLVYCALYITFSLKLSMFSSFSSGLFFLISLNTFLLSTNV